MTTAISKNLFRKSFLTFLFSSLMVFVFGQGIVPQDGNVMHNKSSKPCLYVKVHPSPDELKDAWVEYLDKKHDVKLKGTGFLTNKDVLYAEKITLTEVSDKTMDLYTEIIEVEGETSMKLFAAFGYDIYVNSTDYPTEYAALKKIMTTFLNEYIPNYHSEKVELHQKRVKNFSKEQSSLKKTVDKNEKTIEKMNRKIEKMTEEIEKSKVELKEVEEKLTEEKEKLKFHTGKLNK